MQGCWVSKRGEVVLRDCGGIGDPVSEEDISGAGAQGLVHSFHELGGGDIHPGGGGAWRTRGRPVRPCCRRRVRCARASTGRFFLKGGKGMFVFQLRGR